MKCSDIPDQPILEFLASHGGIGCSWFPGQEYSVAKVMYAIPKKMVLAKMRGLIKRGLVSGCACGCRGDFELTDKGWLRWKKQNDINNKRERLVG
jgi:hypothetical protein